MYHRAYITLSVSDGLTVYLNDRKCDLCLISRYDASIVSQIFIFLPLLWRGYLRNSWRDAKKLYILKTGFVYVIFAHESLNWFKLMCKGCTMRNSETKSGQSFRTVDRSRFLASQNA